MRGYNNQEMFEIYEDGPIPRIFSINCSARFEEQLQQFKKCSQGIKDNQICSVSIYHCKSDQQIKQINQVLANTAKINLTSMSLYGVNLPLDAWKLFTVLKQSKIQAVQIHQSQIDDQCCEFLSSCEMPTIKSVYIKKNCKISAIGYSSIVQCQLPNLTKLKIEYVRLGKLATKHFTKAKWGNLNELVLRACSLFSQSIKILCKCEWNNMKYLEVSNNFISDSQINTLHCANWPSLVTIHLQPVPMTHLGTLTLAKNRLEKVGLEYYLKRRVPSVMKDAIKFF